MRSPAVLPEPRAVGGALARPGPESVSRQRRRYLCEQLQSPSWGFPLSAEYTPSAWDYPSHAAWLIAEQTCLPPHLAEDAIGHRTHDEVASNESFSSDLPMQADGPHTYIRRHSARPARTPSRRSRLAPQSGSAHVLRHEQ